MYVTIAKKRFRVNALGGVAPAIENEGSSLDLVVEGAALLPGRVNLVPHLADLRVGDLQLAIFHLEGAISGELLSSLVLINTLGQKTIFLQLEFISAVRSLSGQKAAIEPRQSCGTSQRERVLCHHDEEVGLASRKRRRRGLDGQLA